jgi:error-prone DNA polymerase
VCYCLGVTEVDPSKSTLLFERFISRERNEPPDIDVDFEHQRREEVIAYIYRQYGHERAAIAATVIRYRPRSALRDVGKALGLQPELIEALSRDCSWLGRDPQPPAWPEGVDPQDPAVQQWLALTLQALDMPRHLGQHVGGFVLTHDKLTRLVPVQPAAMAERYIIQWDKDDLEAVGLMKVDVLALGMLSAIRGCLDLRHQWRGTELQMHQIPADDSATYDMICAADTVGVFQIESRAQMGMLPRLQPRCYYDLVVQVAIVRPGPIQGDMVHPYLRRRAGQEAITYPDARIERVLGRTLGVPLFQEQAMTLAVVAAGFTPGQADQLRRAIAAWKRRGNQLAQFGERLTQGMLANGYTEHFAQQVFTQIKGFSGYGFPESHAISFALIAYASAWMKVHRAPEFFASLLNNQPMGFYSSATLVMDAKAHGLKILPTCINESEWRCTVTRDGAVQLGLCLVAGLTEARASCRRHPATPEGARAGVDVPSAA